MGIAGGSAHSEACAVSVRGKPRTYKDERPGSLRAFFLQAQDFPMRRCGARPAWALPTKRAR